MGMIQAFGFSFAPKGWAQCNGQLVAISQNEALFSLLGINFGGDGRTTFGLPDLRGRVMVGYGNGPGLSSHTMGQKSGQEITQLGENNMPAHTHTANMSGASVTVKANGTNGTKNVPSSRTNVLSGATAGFLYGNTDPDIALNIGGGEVTGNITVDPTGGSQAFSNMQPYNVVNMCIALVGLYPPRN